MIYRIESRINDGKAEAPPIEVETEDSWNDGDFADQIINGLQNDYGQPFGVGSTVTITRIA